jgi:PilZ domain
MGSDPRDPSEPAEADTLEGPPDGDPSHPRRDERVTINKEFESYDAFISEYVTNISRTGVFVRSKAPLAIGTKVNLRFTVIMDDIETVEGIGEVVRVHEDPPGMGVVFTELSGYSKGLIDKLLTTQGRRAPED